VLYAPTWEGAQRSLAYGSVATHGEALVRSLLAAGLDVTYRPHPRTGANDFRARERDLAIRGLLRGTPGGRVDTTTPLAAAFRAADVLVTDISSLTMEWLPTLKPLVVTRPGGAEVVVPESPLLAAVPRLDAADAPRAAELVAGILADDATLADRRALVDHYLGDVTPGAPTRRFVSACEQAIALRRSELARLGAPPQARLG
jgi:CDP-glycerol glycerophosphotransferase (TagB/SpsB family)